MRSTPPFGQGSLHWGLIQVHNWSQGPVHFLLGSRKTASMDLRLQKRSDEVPKHLKDSTGSLLVPPDQVRKHVCMCGLAGCKDVMRSSRGLDSLFGYWVKFPKYKPHSSTHYCSCASECYRHSCSWTLTLLGSWRGEQWRTRSCSTSLLYSSTALQLYVQPSLSVDEVRLMAVS